MKQPLIDNFNKNNYTCLIAEKQSIIFTSYDKGVKPLMEFYESLKGKDTQYQNLHLIDKVIGKGAAFICVLIGIKSINTDIISKSALDALKKYDIDVTYNTKAEYIINRQKTGKCPVETLAENYQQPDKFYEELKKLLKKMGEKNND